MGEIRVPKCIFMLISCCFVMIFESFSFFSFCKKGAKEDEYEDDFEPEPKKDEDEYADDFEAEDPPPGSDSCTKTHKSYKIL